MEYYRAKKKKKVPLYTIGMNLTDTITSKRSQPQVTTIRFCW